MPTQFRLPIPDTPEIVDGQFTDDEWESLLAFRAESERLRRAEWIASGMSAPIHIEWSQGSPLTHSTPNRPSDAQVKEVLHGLRPFILQKDPHFFPRTLNILTGAIRHPWMRAQKRTALDRFVGADVRQLFQLTAGDLELTAPRAIDLWLNAFEYHRDPVKHAEFVKERGGEPNDLDLAVFRSMLVGKVDAIMGLANFITWFVNNSTFVP